MKGEMAGLVCFFCLSFPVALTLLQENASQGLCLGEKGV